MLLVTFKYDCTCVMFETYKKHIVLKLLLYCKLYYLLMLCAGNIIFSRSISVYNAVYCSQCRGK